MEKKIASLAMMAVVELLICLPYVGYGRNFQFQLHKGESSSSNRSYYSNSAKKDSFKITMGTASAKDTDDPMEIRAATLLKEIQSKKMVINDIAKFKFSPSRGREIFYVTTGVANSSKDNWAYIGSDCSHGYIKGGVIIEIWQGGKMVKHWSSSTGPITKTRLTDSVKCAYIDTKGYDESRYPSSFDNATQIVADEDNPKPEKAGNGAAEGGDMALSDFAMAMFRADASLKTMTRNGTLSLSDDYYGPFSEMAQTHWSVSINFECTDGNFAIYGYAPKTSQIGGRLRDLLKDGKPKRVTVKISRGVNNYSPARYVNIEDFCEIKQGAAAGGEAEDDLTELLPSDYSYAMFKADASLKSITFPTKIRLSDSYYMAFANCQQTHWSVEILYSTGDGYSYITGYIEKETAVGKRLLDLIKDGAQHAVLMRVARSQQGPSGTRYVLIKDFKVLDQNDPSVRNLGSSFSGSFNSPSMPVRRRYMRSGGSSAQ